MISFVPFCFSMPNASLKHLWESIYRSIHSRILFTHLFSYYMFIEPMYIIFKINILLNPICNILNIYQVYKINNFFSVYYLKLIMRKNNIFFITIHWSFDTIHFMFISICCSGRLRDFKQSLICQIHTIT